MTRARLALSALLTVIAGAAHAQSVPANMTAGTTWTQKQWNAFAASKADVSGGLATGMVSAAGPGSIARTLAAHFADRYTVKDYGAVGNGSNDDTLAVSAAFILAQQACATGPVDIDFPPGRYMLSTAWLPQITCAYPIAITGAGPGMTTVVFAGSDGFDITASTGTAEVDVSGMQLLRADGGALFANTAVKIIASNSRALVSHLEVQDASGAHTVGWGTGVSLVSTSNALVVDTRVEMPVAPAGTTAGVGFSVGGTSNASFAPDNRFTDDVATGGWAGLSVPGFAQGVYVSKPVFVGNAYGIHWTGTQAGDSAELLVAEGGEFNDSAAGIYVSAGSLSQIVHNHFFRFNPTTTGSWDAIDLEGGNNYAVSNNNIYGAAEGTETGIMADNLGNTPNSITGNVIGSIAGYGISLSGTTIDTITSGNSLNGTAGAVLDASNGKNLLGPVQWNGNPAPVRYDGFHFDLLGDMAIVGPSGAASYLLTDGGSGLRLESVSNSTANLTIDGQIMGGGNILPGVGGALVTRDTGGAAGATESAGYVNPDGAGGLNFGTLKPNAAAESGPIPTVVAALPACNSATWGHFAAVTDATVADTSANAGTAAAGGGSNGAFVRCIPKATSWTIF